MELGHAYSVLVVSASAKFNESVRGLLPERFYWPVTVLTDAAGARRELLENSNDKVSDIAVKTGFCSTKYFNRVFKKMTGLSPAQFRRDSVDGPSGN